MKLQRFVRDIPKFELAQVHDMIENDEDSAAQRDSIEQLFGIDGQDSASEQTNGEEALQI